MASKQELDRLANRAMEDDAFRVALETDPAKAAATLGVSLTEIQIAQIKKAVIEKVDGRKSKGIGVFGAYG